MDKMVCPICGENKIFVGVHDDEGNFHGLEGCEYEQEPWSGLIYALHHDGWGECPLCTSGEYGIMGGMLFDAPEDAITTLLAENARLRKERDAAVSDMETIMAYGGKDTCKYCKNAQCQKRNGTKPCKPIWYGVKED